MKIVLLHALMHLLYYSVYTSHDKKYFPCRALHSPLNSPNKISYRNRFPYESVDSEYLELFYLLSRSLQ